MMIGLRSDPEATLFLTCQRELGEGAAPFPMVYRSAAIVISTVR
jgi:hypothetical protein